MAFATGKFPQAAQMGLGLALRDQEQTVAKNHPGRDVNGI
jgi:hypothetical protein